MRKKIRRQTLALISALLGFASFTSAATAEANSTPARPLVLISDIDDTIRRTHVLDRDEMIFNGMKSDNPFAGLASLYNAWACAPLADRSLCMKRQALTRSPERQVFYVSGAPGQTQAISLLFLKENSFPVGIFQGRNGSEGSILGDIGSALLKSTYEFKVQAIEEIINDFPDADFVLIGDNGERDVSVFKTIAEWTTKNHPQIRIYSFVHQVYSDKKGEEPTAEQEVFVSAIDLAIHMANRGWIGESELNTVATSVSASLQKNRVSVLPDWIDCRSLTSRRSFPILAVPVSANVQQRVSLALEQVRARCAKAPSNND